MRQPVVHLQNVLFLHWAVTFFADMNYSLPSRRWKFSKNLTAMSSHKATSKATNIVLLSKHITEEACMTVASVELPSQADFSVGMLYIFCQEVWS